MAKVNYENLERLHDFLVENREWIKPYFGMETIMAVGGNTAREVPFIADGYECGSVGCLIGWSPEAFPELKSRCLGVMWDVWIAEVFGLTWAHKNTHLIWTFLFAAKWAAHSPSLDSAIARIKYVVDHHNVPEYFKGKDISGYGPVEYKDAMIEWHKEFTNGQNVDINADVAWQQSSY